MSNLHQYTVPLGRPWNTDDRCTRCNAGFHQHFGFHCSAPGNAGTIMPVVMKVASMPPSSWCRCMRRGSRPHVVQDGIALCLTCSEMCNIRIDREAATLPADRLCPHVAAASARVSSVRDHRGGLVALCVGCETSLMHQIDGMWGDARPMSERITRAIDGLLRRECPNPSLPHPTTCAAAHDEKGLSKGWGDSVLANPRVTVSLVGSSLTPLSWKFDPDMAAQMMPVWKELRKKAKAVNFGYRKFDPLDVIYDGISLRTLIERDETSRRETCYYAKTLVQRAAISAHWSTQLRARIAEAAETERRRVLVDVDD